MRYLLIGVAVLSIFMSSPTVGAERKKTPALREQVYSQLARAQQLADDGDVKAGLDVLANVEGKLSSMNSYERAMLWNFYAYMFYGQDNIAKAIEYFAKVVDEEAIPEALEQNTLFSLAQLSLGQGQFEQAIEFIARWEQLTPADQQQKAWVLKAQALYQKGDYQAALQPISKTINAVEAKQQIPEENWLVLQRAIYFELGQTANVASVLEDMVRYYNKPEYWVQLAGVYGQLGQENKQLAMLETAFQQGFLTKGQDLLNLAQTYFFNDLPYKAGQVMEKALSTKAVASNLRNYKLLAQAWIAARETDKANLALQQASALSDNGEFDAQRATLLLNAERNQEALVAAKAALEKGGLKQPGAMHLVIGMAELNLENFNAALQAFAKAKSFDDAKQAASQWERYAKAEQAQQSRLQELRADIQSSS